MTITHRSMIFRITVQDTVSYQYKNNTYSYKVNTIILFDLLFFWNTAMELLVPSTVRSYL